MFLLHPGQRPAGGWAKEGDVPRNPAGTADTDQSHCWEILCCKSWPGSGRTSCHWGSARWVIIKIFRFYYTKHNFVKKQMQWLCLLDKHWWYLKWENKNKHVCDSLNFDVQCSRILIQLLFLKETHFIMYSTGKYYLLTSVVIYLCFMNCFEFIHIL